MSDLARTPDASATPVYRLVGREPTGFGLGGRRLSPFVGREHELALLLDRLRQVASGRGHVVGVVGEPGIGKSRLLFELRCRLEAEGLPCLEGRCLSRGAGTPYLPLVDLLRRAWDIDESEDTGGQVAVVRRRVAALSLDVERETPYLGRLLGLEVGTERLAVLTPEGLKLGTFDALRQMLLATARGGRLVVLVEDLHWIDRTSEEFLRSLVDALPGGPILLVVTARPGYRPPWMDRSYASQIGLPPLSAGQSLELVRSVLPSDATAEATARRLAAQGDGNPFFLEELAWAVAQGATPDPAVARIPDTIEATLAARIDRLAEGPRRVLETAAVLGREIPLAVLELLWDGSRLTEHLRALVGLEFLYAHGNGLYAFKHALTQEVAYGRLAPAERERLHAAAGHAYEALHAGRLQEVIDRLAFHFARTREHATALDYLTRFAERATRGYALEEALVALNEALGHAQALPDGRPRDRAVVQVLLEEGLPLMLLGRYAEVPQRLGPQASLVERLGDGAARARYHFLLAFAYSHLGERRRAGEAGHRALEEASRQGDVVAIGRSHMARSLESFWTGRFRDGVTHGAEAVAHLEGTLDWFLGFAAWCHGLNAIALGDLDLALEAARQTETIGETMGDRRHRSFGSWLAGWALALRGTISDAIDACERALALATDPVSRAVASQWLGHAHLEAGAAAQAVPLLEQAAGQFRAFRFTALESWASAWLGDALTRTGATHAAGQRAADGARLAEQVQFAFGLGLAQRALGRARLAEGDAAGAAIELGRAREAFAAMEARYELARTGLDLAVAGSRLGDPAGAAADLVDAHDVFRQLGVPSWVERTERLARDLGVALIVGHPGAEVTRPTTHE